MRWLPAAGPAPEIDSSKFSYEISLLLPESRRESVLGGLGLYNYRNDSLAFSDQWPTMLPSGFKTKGARPQDLVSLLRGLFSSGRQTELRQSPEPRNVFSYLENVSDRFRYLTRSQAS